MVCKLRFYLLFVISFFTLICSPAFSGNDPEEILSRLRKKYDKNEDISVSYTQSVVFGVTKNEQSNSGKFWMKKGNKYRIESEDQTIVTDGKSVWSYSKSNQQVFVENYKDDPKALTPERILVNVPQQSLATILGKEKIGSRETTILKLVPKDEVSQKTTHAIASNWKWIKMWVDEDEWVMRKIQVLDLSDNLTTYSIDNIKLNTKLDDTYFQFEKPPDVEVIDLR